MSHIDVAELIIKAFELAGTAIQTADQAQAVHQRLFETPEGEQALVCLEESLGLQLVPCDRIRADGMDCMLHGLAMALWAAEE